MTNKTNGRIRTAFEWRQKREEAKQKVEFANEMLKQALTELTEEEYREYLSRL